jgi:hypothetical protein
VPPYEVPTEEDTLHLLQARVHVRDLTEIVRGEVEQRLHEVLWTRGGIVQFAETHRN